MILEHRSQDDLIDMLVNELEEPNTQSSLPRKDCAPGHRLELVARIRSMLPTAPRVPM